MMEAAEGPCCSTEARLLRSLRDDLALYCWCRRLRLVPRYMAACLNKASWGCLLRPLFSHDARAFASNVEWCLARLFGVAKDARPVTVVLAYLPLHSFQPSPTSTREWVEYARGLSVFGGAEGERTSPGLTSQPTPSRAAATQTPPTALKRPRDEVVGTPLGGGPLSEPSSNSLPPLALISATPEKVVRTPPPQSPGGAAPLPSGQAHFFLRPPFHDVTHVFARMLATTVLNDEELNRYFGRFGQVGSRRVRCEPVVWSAEYGTWALEGNTSAHPLGSAVAATSAARSASRRGGAATTWLMQDFVIEVDLPANAQGALVELRDPAILFVAPSHLDRNLYTSSDLDTSLLRTQQDVTVLRGEKADAAASSTFIPDLVVDRVPYWFTPEQFAFLCAAYGDVASVRYSIDDRSGAFTGAAMLTMATSEGARSAAHGLHGKVIEADHQPLVCGVLNANLQLVSLLDESMVLLETPYAKPLLRVLRSSDPSTKTTTFANPRLWL